MRLEPTGPHPLILRSNVMLGPLPRMYRWIVAVVSIVSFVGLGFWAARALPIDLVPPTGSLTGLALGALVVAVLLRDSDRTDQRR